MDYTLRVSINRLKKISLYLFIFTNIAIFGILFTHNILTSSHYKYNINPYSNDNLENIDCNKNNNYCYKYSWLIESEKLDQCPLNHIYRTYNVDFKSWKDEDYSDFESFLFDKDNNINSEYRNSNIFISFSNTRNDGSSQINVLCIKNYPITYSIYKIFPQLPKLIHDIKNHPNYFDATKKTVNPFFYGETTISNIAKRYPLYFIFKPFLFITSILMIIYWFYTRKVILSFNKSEKIQLYYLFGVLSGIFLFLHVLFLGSEIQNEFFQKVRRLFVVFFIFFELLAQLLLIRKLLIIRVTINNFIRNILLQIKKFFVYFFIFLTLITTSLLIIFNISKEVNYIIEWNYFVILSFYYLLTFFLWKKINL